MIFGNLPHNMMLAKKVAVVDDVTSMGQLMKEVLETEGLEVKIYSSAEQALNDFKNNTPNVLITDLRMPGMDGMALLKRVQQEYPGIVTIMMTAYGSIETAIEAMKNGAYHYLVKPFKNDELLLATQRGLERSALKQENFLLRSKLKQGIELESMIGKDPKMIDLFALIRKLAHASANVVIHGESGTGKELVARAIHNCSAQANGPFVTLNCGSISDDMFDVDFFGQVDTDEGCRGKKGILSQANSGTLYLEGVGELSQASQAKLVRVLIEKSFTILGAESPSPLNVRIISSTDQNLETLVAEGRFREDLFYRLNVLPVFIPALRHRADDIPLLAQHFLHRYAVANQSSVNSISPGAMSALMAHPWPGNVRELESLIERAVVLATGDSLQKSDVLGTALDKARKDIDQLFADRPSLEKLEERYIKLILGETDNQKEKASNVLGISRRTLYRKERTYGLVSMDSSEPNEDSPDHSSDAAHSAGPELTH